jgi:hypothetical protein
LCTRMCRLSAKISRDCVHAGESRSQCRSSEYSASRGEGFHRGRRMAPSYVLHYNVRVVHLSRGHRVSPMTVGRLCVLECEYVWSRKLELEYVYSNVNMSSFLGRGRPLADRAPHVVNGPNRAFVRAEERGSPRAARAACAPRAGFSRCRLEVALAALQPPPLGPVATAARWATARQTLLTGHTGLMCELRR